MKKINPIEYLEAQLPDQVEPITACYLAKIDYLKKLHEVRRCLGKNVEHDLAPLFSVHVRNFELLRKDIIDVFLYWDSIYPEIKERICNEDPEFME